MEDILVPIVLFSVVPVCIWLVSYFNYRKRLTAHETVRHAIDSGPPAVWSPPGLVFANGGDEHGLLRAAHAGHPLPALGDTVWLVPGHCDPTVNLYDVMVGVRGGLVDGKVERLIRVDARGALG